VAGAWEGELAVSAGTISAVVEAFSGAVTTCRKTSAEDAVVSFIGVKMAVNAVSPLAAAAIDGVGTGNCGALVTLALMGVGAGEDCVGAGAVKVVGIGAGATIAVKDGISASLRNCFFASAATGRAAVGRREGPAVGEVRLRRVDSIAESSIGEGVGGAEGAVKLPNIDLIIESAICAGDAVVTGAFAVLINVSVGACAGELSNRLIILTNAGACGATLAFAVGNAMAARMPFWLVPIEASEFTPRTDAGQCPKRANLNSVA
jgi:hypothetical protein